MAVVLNVSLSGPRSYHGERRDFPWVWPEGRDDIGPDQIDAACSALWRAWAALLALGIVLAALSDRCDSATGCYSSAIARRTPFRCAP